MRSFLGTLWNKSGSASIAEHDADPRFLCHISDHPGGVDVSDELADCGFPYANVLDAGRTARICPRCAALHAEQPWIQRLKQSQGH